ncbi:hypothetical protein K469DRAFT_579566, partial [Zopfia rhizophila CBS 207.26]
VDTTVIIPAAVPDATLELELEDPHPAKRRRLAERRESPILESTSTPNSIPLLDLSSQASRFRTSEGPISGPLGTDHRSDGGVSLVSPLSDLCGEGDVDDAAYVQGTVEELVQSSRESISPFEGLEGDQDVGRNFDRREMNGQGSGSKVWERLGDELRYNNEVFGIPLAKRRRRRRKDWASKRKRGLSNTAPRPQDRNTVPTRAQRQVRSSQPQHNSMPPWPGIDNRPRSRFLRSFSPGTTTSDGASLDLSYQITDLTLCAIPSGSSIVKAIVRYRDSNLSLDPVALGRKFLGGEGEVIHMTQLSPDSWMLLGYRYNDDASGLCTRGSLNADWMRSSHSNAANHETDHSDDDWDEEGEDGEEGTDEYSQRTPRLWLQSDEARLLSYRDKQGMEWNEIYKRFPGRTLGAVQLRYYTLRKKDR